MATKKIKGITIEIGGNTVNLQKEINKANSSVRSLQTELKGVNTLLKTDPSNVTLLTQKQDLLTKAVSETKDKLNMVREAEKQAQEQFQKGEITEEQYREIQREVIATEQKLESLEKEAKNFGSVFQQQCEVAGEKMKEVGGKIEGAGKKMLPASAAIAGIGVASVKTAADFDSSMSQVAATMGMTSEEINNGSEDYAKLEKAARDMGAATKYSASEAADALNYLALAGYDVDTSIETLPTVLNLAASGGLELGTASDMVTDAMSALGLKTEEAGSFVDKMAKASQKSNTNVAQLGEAILTVGGTAKNLKGGVTELNTSLGILADNGIKGSEGGTKLRNMILSLSAPTDKAAGQMEALGLKAYDADGNLRPLNDIFNDLNSTLSTMSQGEQTEVLNTIFNKTDLKAVNALLANSGKRFDELSGYINDSTGAAGDMADTMQNNLNGQITVLKSALSEAAISIGQSLMPLMKGLTSIIQSLVDKFNNLSPTAKTIIIVIAGIVAAIGPMLIFIGALASAIGSIITILPKVKAAISVVKGAMAALNTTMLANPIFLIIAAIAALVAAFVILYKKCDWFRDAVDKVWAKIKEGFQSVVEWVKGIPEKVSAFFSNIVNFFKENWQGLLLLIVNPFAGAFKLLYDNCEGFRNTINNLVEKIKLFFTQTIPEAIKTVIKWFSDLPYNIGVAIGLLIGHIVKFGKNVLEFFTIKLPEYITIAINWFKSLPNKIWNALVSAITKIATWCSNMKTKAQTGISNLITSVVTWFKSLPSKISSAIIGGVNAISTWCSNMKTKAVSGVKNVASAVVDGFKNLPDKMLNVGKNIVEGIWKGIQNAKNWVIDKVKDFASGIVDGMKDALGIHSPSRVFRDEVGRFIAEGIGVGITENQNSPIEALKNVGSNMLNSAKNINGVTLNRQIENTFKGSVSTDGAVLGILKNIENNLGKTQIVLDSGKLVGETTRAYDNAFGAMRVQVNRGW